MKIKELKKYIKTPKSLRQILIHFNYDEKLMADFTKIVSKNNIQTHQTLTRWGYRTYYCSIKKPNWNKIKGF